MIAKTGRTDRTDRMVALCGMIWFILIIDACFTWGIPDLVRNIIGSIFVFYATIVLVQNKGCVVSKKRSLLFYSILFLFLFKVLRRFSSFSLIDNFFIFAPLMCVVLWRDSALKVFYNYFKKFVVFYAIVSIIVEFLVITGIWTKIPYIYIYPPQDFVQEQLDLVNYFYGFFCIPASDTSLTFYRACGPLREGGHFIFFIGYVYFVEKALYNHRNLWLLICGILTLSPNCVVILLITEFYCAIKEKRFFKPIIGTVSIVAGGFLLFFISPQVIKDEVIRIVFERMLEKSIENAGSDGFIAILDGRVGDEGLNAYSSFNNSGLVEKLVGSSSFNGDGLMSDYRWMLMRVGYIGTVLVIWCTFVFTYKMEKNLFGLCLLLIALLAFLQRAWMFYHTYFWVILLLITNFSNNFYQRTSLCRNH